MRRQWRSCLQLVLVGAILFRAVPASAQRYSFRIFSEAQGLTDLDVSTVVQDRAGFVWVGTNNGLFRYDGHRFRRYGVTAGLPAAAISGLLETHDGTLWVATEAGLSRRDGDRFLTVDSGGIAPERGSETIAEDPVHRGIYLATSKGVERISASGGHEWVPETAGNTVWSVFTDFAGLTWFAESARICRISDKVRCFGAEANVTRDAWGGLVVDGAGTLWARSPQRLIALEPGKTQFERRDEGLPYAWNVGALSVDRAGHLLVPTGAGLAVPNTHGRKQGWTMVDADAGLAVPTVSWAVPDREGLIWIGTRGGGVACWLGPGEWQNWTTQQGLKSDEIWAMTRASDGNLLAGTTYGVSQLNGSRFEPVVQIRRKLSRYRVLAILAGGPGRGNDWLWIGTAPGGLFRYNRATRELQHFTPADGIPEQTVYSLALGPDGAIWAGGLEGLYRGVRQGARWMFHKEDVGWGHQAEYFNQILLDHSGRLWVSGSHGLAYRHSGGWARITSRGALVGRLGGRLAEAPDGAIWFGPRDSSDLERISFEGHDWNVRSVEASSESGPQVTYFLGFDREGNLWRGTGLGVSELVHGQWVRYTHNDGLVWDDTNANAFFADQDNSVWIGTSGGISHHVPVPAEALSGVDTLITRARTAAETLEDPRGGRIKDQNGGITIEYAVPIFRRPRDIRFRYRLNGVDSGWMESSTWEAHYSGLPAGRYRFEVQAGSWNGGWYARPATLDLTLVGPWWKSRPVLTGSACLLALCIVVVWRRKEREHRQRENRLEAAVQERTEQIENDGRRERDANAILEMVVANQPSTAVLDAISTMVCKQTGASMCCVLLRRGENQVVASACGIERSIQASLSRAGVVPFEAWRSPVLTGSSDEFVWRSLASAFEESGEPVPQFVLSRLLGNPAAPLGLMLVFFADEKPPETVRILDTNARLARIAIEHGTMYDNLNRQARHDPLTGLPNRLRIEESLEVAIRECDVNSGKLALFYIDMDGFKEINDTLTHRAGDLYLREMAERMRRTIRAGDVVGRIGGDEFIVVLPMISGRDAAEDIAKGLLDEIRRPVIVENREVSGTASLGLAIYPDDAIEADELQRKADAAMYRAKGSGRDRYQHCDDAETTIDPSRMDQEIRAAIAGDCLRIDYQPKVNVAGVVAGLEALVRLMHPVHGEIAPGQFIPTAERTGLIVPLGAWVLNEVCMQIADWLERGIRVVPVAVNVSSVQVCREDFAASVEETLRRHDISPSLIELELTESVLMGSSDIPAKQMQTLRNLGIKFSIDDFGSGYSSLSYLHRLRTDAIKLDRSFVQSIETDSSARKLVEGMIGAAERMGLRVIAEGVETEEQMTALVEAGCKYMQGFFLARPQPARDIEPILQRGKSDGGLRDLNSSVELAGVGAVLSAEPAQPESVRG